MGKIWEYTVQKTIYEKKVLKDSRHDIYEKNLGMLRYVNLGSLLVFTGNFFTSSIADLEKSAFGSRLTYAFLVLTILSLIAYIALQYIKKLNINIAIYASNLIIVAYAFVISAFSQPDIVSVTFIVSLFITHNLYIDYSWRINVFALLSTMLYLFAISPFKSAVAYEMEFLNAITVAALSASIGYMMRFSRIAVFESKKELQNLVYVDQLTGISNRRKFFEDIDSPKQKITALSIIDIDLFKNYNDIYGHQQGDDCLRSIGGCFASFQKRYGDNICIYRYGGEEFSVTIYDCLPEKTMLLIDELLGDIKALNIKHSASPSNRVTVSVGVAYVDEEHGNRYESIITKADIALYKAKENGRNQAMYYEHHMGNTENHISNKIRQR